MSDNKLRWLYITLSIAWMTTCAVTFFVFVPKGGGGMNWELMGDYIGLIVRHIVLHYLIILIIFLSAWVLGGRLLSLLRPFLPSNYSMESVEDTGKPSKTRACQWHPELRTGWKKYLPGGVGLNLEFGGMLEKTVISISLGIVAMSFAVMLLGFAHLLYRPVMWLLAIAPLVIWHRALFDELKRASSAWGAVKITGLQTILLVTLIVCILMVCLNPLYPPTSVDAVNYQLTIPKTWLNAGCLILDPYVKYSMVPNNHTLLFTMSMGMGSAETAVLAHFGIWCLLLAAIVAFGARYLSVSGGLVAAIAFALIPATTVTATLGNSEGFIALYALMSLWAAWRYLETRKQGDAILAGIFLGYVVGVKIFMGMLWIWLLVAMIAYPIIRNMKVPWKGLVVIALVSCAMLLPWFVRSAIYFGNPIFPYFNDKLSSLGGIYAQYEPELQSDIHAGLENFSPAANEVSLITLPKEMTYWPSWGTKPGKPAQYRFIEEKERGIGIIFIALLPLLIFVRRKWPLLIVLMSISLLCILTWFYGMKVVYIRYWAFLFPLLALCGGYAFAETFRLDNLSVRKPLGVLFASLLAVLVFTYFLNDVMPRPGAGKLPLTDQSREAVLVKSIPGYPLIKQLNNMSPEPKVYFLYGAPSRYYCDFFVIAGFTTPYNIDSFWEHASNGNDLAVWLRSAGITHLLVNEPALAQYKKVLPSDVSFKANFKPVGSVGRVDLYELNPVN